MEDNPKFLTEKKRQLDAYLKAAMGKRSVSPTQTTTPPRSAGPKTPLKIGELAKLTHETIHILRDWTSVGLLKVAKYSRGGSPLYQPKMIERVKKIRRLQDQGRRTVKEVKEIFGADETSTTSVGG